VAVERRFAVFAAVSLLDSICLFFSAAFASSFGSARSVFLLVLEVVTLSRYVFLGGGGLLSDLECDVAFVMLDVVRTG